MVGRFFSSMFSLSNDKGCCMGRTNSLISWREQNKGILEDIYRPLHTTIPEVSVEEGASSFESLSRDPSEVESLSDLSYQKCISFSKFLSLQVDGNKREITALLRNSNKKKKPK
ncbi:unnamed protein product, partial [Vitis vinifera]